ncbi:MAG: 3-hydroxyacyl-CoA dehydrogenase, partial [Streptomyces sp.]|nr:3-hydroxyacyl-CoA dehydrogenase [Streptomyces sp.]
MTALDLSSPVAVVGTGTMGQGIAQVALVAGHLVRLYDAAPGRAQDAADAIGARLDRLVEKDRLSAADRDAARARLTAAAELSDLADCSLVVEAVLERLDVKQELFRALEDVVGEDCLLATNTSSLSVTAIGGALRNPGRLVGLHFFNPAPLLPLVEVVSGFATDVTSATRAYETARAWGKTPVACADTPGFIVNRIARPYYAEAFAVYEAQGADPATIDAVLRESGGFKMGAFELTDLIGQDVNESVTHSVWQSFFQDVRFTPSLAQRRLVESGRLGRKSGHGWYDHGPDAEPAEPHTAEPAQAPAYVVAEGDLGPASELLALIREAGIQVREDEEDHGTRLVLPSGGQLALADGQTSVEFRDVVYFDLALDYRRATRIALSASQDTAPKTLAEAIGLFQALGKDVSVIGDVPGMIVARTVARIVDLA